jgi:hypothetical protein
MRSFDASSSNNALRDASASPASRLDHLQLLHNAALKFDAIFNVLVFPLDVGKRFARLITHALKRGAQLRPRLGVNRALCDDAVGSKKSRYWSSAIARVL